MIIFTDVDNTIANTGDMIDFYLKEMGHTDLDYTDYNRGLEGKVIAEAIDKMIDAGDFLRVRPRNGAAQFLSAFAAAGNQVHYCTVRKAFYGGDAEAALLDLKQWLSNNRFPMGRIILCDSVAEKADKAVASNASLVVDDLPEFCEEALSRNMLPALIENPWNRLYNNDYVLKCKRWQDMSRIVFDKFGIIV